MCAASRLRVFFKWQIEDETRRIGCTSTTRQSKKVKERTHVTCHSNMNATKKNRERMNERNKLSRILSTTQTLIAMNRRRPLWIASHVFAPERRPHEVYSFAKCILYSMKIAIVCAECMGRDEIREISAEYSFG